MTAQTKPQMPETNVSRRKFLAGAGGLTFAFSVSPWIGGKDSVAIAASGKTPINAWVTIGADNLVTILAPAVEMGQGVMTSLPMIIAEELDADWPTVRVEQSPPNHKIYGNPGFGGFLITVGSRSVKGYWDKLRLVGAQARRVLLDAAAQKWGVPVAELSTGPSVVMHAKSGRKMTYGEIAAFAKAPATLPALTKADL